MMWTDLEKAIAEKQIPAINWLRGWKEERQREWIAKLDAIVLFTGYGTKLCDHAVSLLKQNGTPVLIVGPDSLVWQKEPNADAGDYRSYLLDQLSMKSAGDTRSDPCSVDALPGKETQYTHNQSRETARFIASKEWKVIGLITAAYHQPRAYLTLLEYLRREGLVLRLDDSMPVMVVPLPYLPSPEIWTTKDQEMIDPCTWNDALDSEKKRIEKYQRKGTVASWCDLFTCLSQYQQVLPDLEWL